MPLKPKRIRSALFLLVVALLAFVLWFTIFRHVEHVETATVNRGNLELSVTALGNLRPRNYVDVGAQASGAIRRLHVQAGARVNKGDLLVEIDPAVQQAKVDADRASLASLHAQLAQAHAERVLAAQRAARQQQMMSDGATRLEDVQTAQANLDVAVARINDLHAQINGATSTLKGDEAQLGYTRIYAPITGTVVSLDAREGQTLNATYQTPLIMRIADLSHMTVWTQVSEADIGHVKAGMPVYFTTLGGQTDTGPRRWHGTVRQVLPAPPTPLDKSGADTSQQSPTGSTGKVVLYTVLVDVDNDDGVLMPEMTAQVFFIIASAKNVLLAPMTPLVPVNAQAGVFTANVLVDGKPVERKVRIGLRDRLDGEVLDGLKQGDALITSVSTVRAGAGRFQW
ncbi:efflux transporter periplasmic adaptor subunit [Pandoraea capi]|uniref:Efflux transporter periplasmic adaptor subunit n=1 Tax=Pandoraea capi TaxID=2508286 RepID=A0ABY6W1R4_9BURK|nr:efflux RND transporter periplasmic adaptor subunit [Pandoraea capi]VVE15716.1 efflux transporter periplasmic adaptor subunit [Pandoraea capi]